MLELAGFLYVIQTLGHMLLWLGGLVILVLILFAKLIAWIIRSEREAVERQQYQAKLEHERVSKKALQREAIVKFMATSPLNIRSSLHSIARYGYISSDEAACLSRAHDKVIAYRRSIDSISPPDCSKIAEQAMVEAEAEIAAMKKK